MGWDLYADVQFKENDDIFDIIRAFLSCFEGSIYSFLIEVHSLSSDNLTPYKERIRKDFGNNYNNVIDKLKDVCAKYLPTDKNVSLSLALCIDNDENVRYMPKPYIHYIGDSNKYPNWYSRPLDAHLGFGKPSAFMEKLYLTNGTLLNEQFIIDTLRHLCVTCSPKSLLLNCEETIYYPMDYHFIYHHDLEGYRQDIIYIIDNVLNNGSKVQGLPSFIKAEHDAMIFAKRKKEYIDILKIILANKVDILKSKEIPAQFTGEFIEHILLREMENPDDVMEFFFTETGLGIYALPFLKSYCDDFYMVTIEELADS